jgi:signal peptidase I
MTTKETAATPDGTATPSSDGSIKETIESIIVAFILAFIFRGFVVEAFVIPTGSMAPTLLGAHMRFKCPDCGYGFDVNYQNDSGDPDDVNVPRFAVVQAPGGATQNRVYSILCPNCGFKFPRVDPEQPANDATAPPVRYGDRILVLKYLYLFQQPQRWDVVVFKAPFQPARFDYSQNYIKRLVGKPGESVMILDGDVYVGKPGGALEDYKVQTKPHAVQEALWRIVANNDYLPQGLKREETNMYGQPTHELPPWQRPWTETAGERGWDLSGRTFTFDNRDGAATIYFDASANSQKHPLTDWLAYDSTWEGGMRLPADTYAHPTYEPFGNVSDVKVKLSYERSSGDGPLRVQVTKLDWTFTAEITPTTATLFMRRGGGTASDLGQAVAPAVSINPKPGRPMNVELINADYRVTLRIDGRDVVSTTPDQYHPDVAALMQNFREGPGKKLPKPQIRISAERQTARVSHLSLWRDIYYINRGERRDQSNRSRTAWASPDRFPENVMNLGADEYFVLGDNSLISGDARTWDDAINLPEERLQVESGRVPGRFLLGKAFFVYWPAGYRPIESAPALAPNFGDMRFIH